MRIAITGGTGFVGRNIADALIADGHEVILIAQNRPHSEVTAGNHRGILFAIGLDSAEKLAEAFAECDAVAHCAGINREIGLQTYERVHVQGTGNVIAAARQAGVRKVILISFLRARPYCGSAYHESKFAAEEIVRQSGLDYTVFKCSVIYGRGDHMLDHLSHAFYSFPLFAFVGFRDKPIRPNAVEDVARIVKESLTRDVLSRRTVAVVGPETLTLRQAVLRVASVIGRIPLAFPMPVWFHYALGWLVEKIMVMPLVSVAQVRMLSEGLAEPLPPCDELPANLAPRIHFTETQIRKGLPPPGSFGLRDLRCCNQQKA